MTPTINRTQNALQFFGFRYPPFADTFEIGKQVWPVENLKTTKFNDGHPIPLIPENSEWNNSSSPAYCWFANDIRNKKNMAHSTIGTR
jgi:hypothetical protein